MKNKKQEFLKKIESPGKLKYKRYLGSPLRYAGGKSLAVGFVAELIPDNITKIVSPFMGGGSIEIACAKEMGLEVEAYDIFPELVNYWQCQIEQPQALAKSLSELEPTREEFIRVKEILKKHWKNEEVINDRMKLAQLYYFDHNTSYGPHFLGSPSSVYLDKTRYQKMIEKVSMFDVPKLKVECKSFEEVIPAHPNDFLYCDPPYYLEGDSKTFIGMYPHRNFPIYHKGFKHELLRDLLMNHKGRLYIIL